MLTAAGLLLGMPHVLAQTITATAPHGEGAVWVESRYNNIVPGGDEPCNTTVFHGPEGSSGPLKIDGSATLWGEGRCGMIGALAVTADGTWLGGAEGIHSNEAAFEAALFWVSGTKVSGPYWPRVGSTDTSAPDAPLYRHYESRISSVLTQDKEVWVVGTFRATQYRNERSGAWLGRLSNGEWVRVREISSVSGQARHQTALTAAEGGGVWTVSLVAGAAEVRKFDARSEEVLSFSHPLPAAMAKHGAISATERAEGVLQVATMPDWSSADVHVLQLSVDGLKYGRVAQQSSDKRSGFAAEGESLWALHGPGRRALKIAWEQPAPEQP